MRCEPPEFYAALKRDRAKQQITDLPDEVCEVIAYSKGWTASMVVSIPQAVRAYLAELNEEMRP